MEQRNNSMEDILHDLFGSDDSSAEEYETDNDGDDNMAISEYVLHAENPNWKSFLAGLQPESAKQYVKRVTDFLEFKQRRQQLVQTEERLSAVLIAYFEEKREAVKDDGSRLYKATNFKGWLIQIDKFYLYTEQGSIKQVCPIIFNNIKNWAKHETVVQAKVFSKEDLAAFYDFEDPNDYHNILLRKVYAVIAVGFAARTKEVFDLDWSQIELAINGPRGQRKYLIKYKRRAKETAPGTEDRYAVISGEDEVAIIDEYIDVLRPQWRDNGYLEPKSGRFFVKLVKDYRGKTIGTQRVIGKNTAASFGKSIAKALGKPDWEKYTGHCFRRSAITFAAEGGLSVNQIKDFSGHKSDGVVQTYINHSEGMKRIQAEAVAVSSKRPREIESYLPSTGFNAFRTSGSAGITFVVNGPMSLGGISGGVVGDVACASSDKPSENEDSSNRNRAKRGRVQAR